MKRFIFAKSLPILTLISILLLAACSGKTLHRYTLDAADVSGTGSVRYSSIRVDYPKGIPDTMSDRIYYSKSDLSQSYYLYHQWSQPLNRIIMAQLIAALQRSHLAKTVLDYASEAESRYTLETTIYRFEHRIDAHGSYAVVSIGLRLLRSDDKSIVKSRRFDYRIPTPTVDAPGFVEAANEAMKRLSRDMVRWLAR
ncbi:ABC-type transport auxiliary lipoprotein family protein [Nitratifractor sp.]